MYLCSYKCIDTLPCENVYLITQVNDFQKIHHIFHIPNLFHQFPNFSDKVKYSKTK